MSQWAQKRNAPEIQQSLLAFGISKRARRSTNDIELVVEVEPTSYSQVPEVGSSVHFQIIQIYHPSNLVDVPNPSLGVNILTDLHDPDVTNSFSQDLDAIEINGSALPISHYDVGDILNGRILLRNLSDDAKANYVKHHFTPGNNFNSFIKQAIVHGKTKQKKVLVFQNSWLERYGWLVYSPTVGGGLCKYCIIFSSENDIRKYGGVLVNKPFINLVKATGKDGILEHHQGLQYHKDAVQLGLLLLQHQRAPEISLPFIISQAKQEIYRKNLHILKAVIEAVILCEKQNRPLRGHRDDNTGTSSNKGNFWAIFKLMSRRDDVSTRTSRKWKKECAIHVKSIQNETIDIIAEYIRKENTRSMLFDNSFFTIMADEVTDPHSNQEILSECLRLLNDNEIKEFSFAFVYLERATGETIANAIIESLKYNNIDITKAREQSYEGAACMSSDKVGVQARIRQVSPRAVYVHCNSHVLNLSIASACKLPVIRNMIDTLNAVFLFFDRSPKRQRFLEIILKNMAPETHKTKLVGLCKTRWVERHTCFDTFYTMYESLCKCLEAMLDPPSYPQIYEDTWSCNTWDQETRSKAQGLLSNLESSTTIIAFIITKNALEIIRPIASKLQKRDLDIYEAYTMIDRTKDRITALRHDINDEYNAWYEEITRLVSTLAVDITSPRVAGPRSSRQLHRANAPSTCPKEYYLRNLAIPFVDYLLTEFNYRFNPEGRRGVEILALLPCAITLDNVDLESVVTGLMFWEPDLPFSCPLRSEVKEWQHYWNSKEHNQLSINLSECLRHADEDIFPNILTLLKIGCTLPIGSCESERSFYACAGLKPIFAARWDKSGFLC